MVNINLLKQCTEDNRKAHFELYKDCFGCLYKVCKRYYNNEDELKSALNMIFLKVITNLGSFIKKEKAIETFDFWISRIAVNHIIDEYRKAKKYKEAMKITADFNAFEITDSLIFENENQIDEIMHAIEQLPTVSKKVFKMYTIDGYKHKEIAALLNITENTCRVHFHTAKEKLRDILSEKKLANASILFMIFMNQ